MPSVRNKDKAIISCWVHKDIHAALGILAKVSERSVTSLMLEALAEKFRFTLDEEGNPVGLDVGALAKEAYRPRERPAPRSGA